VFVFAVQIAIQIRTRSSQSSPWWSGNLPNAYLEH